MMAKLDLQGETYATNELYHSMDGTDKKYEGIISDENYALMHYVTFYLDYKADYDPGVEVRSGWWDPSTMTESVPLSSGGYVTDNGDGTFTAAINLANDCLATEVTSGGTVDGIMMDVRHLLFLSTWGDFTPLRLYFANYQITSGANTVIPADNTEDIAFISGGPYADFKNVEVDGNAITRDTDYTVEDSTKIILDDSYISTLSSGAHALSIIFEDGISRTQFTVEASSSEELGSHEEGAEEHHSSDSSTSFAIPVTGIK